MAEAILVVNFLSAAIAAGLNATVALERVSSLLKLRHASGGTISQDDLIDLFQAGDALEAEVMTKIRASLADPDTPKQ